MVIKINFKYSSTYTVCLHFRVCRGLEAESLGKRGNERVCGTKIKKMLSLMQGSHSLAEEPEACTAEYNTVSSEKAARGVNEAHGCTREKLLIPNQAR